MKSFFSKLDNVFLNPDSDWEKFKGPHLYSQYNSGPVLLQYFNINNIEEFKKQHYRKIFSLLPDRVSFAVIYGKGVLLPHKDHGCQVSLNYYIDAEDDVTQFYEALEPNVVGATYPGKIQSNIFNETDLLAKDNFVAKSNELFLLNVSEIHSVIKTSIKPRVFIAYSWNHITYEELLTDIQRHLNE
jgi:hypothetical protein